jgi:hypothetical protein
MKKLLEFLSPDRSLLISFILFLAAVPSFVFCRTHHFCIYGHLEDNVTYWGHANDYFWQTGFIGGVILSFRSGIAFRYLFTFGLGVGFLLVADPRNLGGILIFPVTGALCLFALACLLGWID